tara:strand:- start:15 stop:1022 length:1008 start_codon:yes stop_codon:yes gene_type:complete
MADNEFVLEVEPYITNPIARMDLLRRTSQPGVYKDNEFIPSEEEPISISDDLNVRPIFVGSRVSENAYLGGLKATEADVAEARRKQDFISGLRGMTWFPEGETPKILLNPTPSLFDKEYNTDPDTEQVPSQTRKAEMARTLQHELIHSGLEHLRKLAPDPEDGPRVGVRGRKSALGGILEPYPKIEGPTDRVDHEHYMNIIDVASAINSGVLDPTDEEQLLIWRQQYWSRRTRVNDPRFVDSAMQAGIELSDRASEEDLEIPVRFRAKYFALSKVEAIKKAEKELLVELRPLLKEEGFSQSHIEAAFGPEEEKLSRRIFRQLYGSVTSVFGKGSN